MSWFVLGKSKSRKKNIGIWLRVRANSDVKEAITNSGLKRPLERVWKIEIVELREDNEVLLEVWAQNIFHIKERHNVFHLLMKENPEWVCEGDAGKNSEE